MLTEVRISKVERSSSKSKAVQSNLPNNVDKANCCKEICGKLEKILVISCHHTNTKKKKNGEENFEWRLCAFKGFVNFLPKQRKKKKTKETQNEAKTIAQIANEKENIY